LAAKVDAAMVVVAPVGPLPANGVEIGQKRKSADDGEKKRRAELPLTPSLS
jgi:hypothetical protein